MSDKQECPNCRKSANEGHIRPNPIIEEVISAWKEARWVHGFIYLLHEKLKDKLRRPFVLNLIKQQGERKVNADQPKNIITPRKRKRTDSPYFSNSSSVPLTPKSRLKSQEVIDVLDCDDDPTIPSSDANEDEMIKPTLSSYVPLLIMLNSILTCTAVNDIVQCPMCDKSMSYERLNPHIDSGCKKYALTDARKEWQHLMGSKNIKGKRRLAPLPWKVPNIWTHFV